MEFGLTGGIGSGKSTVSLLLSLRGVVIIDADAIVRHLQAPGELVFDAMVNRWGSDILKDDGTLDRAGVGAIVFNDPVELDALNAIVHPAVADETEQRVAAQRGSEVIVVHDIPLLILPGGELLTSRDVDEWSGVVVVDTPVELAIERVIESRGMGRADVEARMAAQASRDDRRHAADFIIDNSGDLAELDHEIERLWTWMQQQGNGPEHE